MKYTIENASITISGNTVLEEINIEITKQSHIGITGKNGSGKTTLLNALKNPDILEEGLEDKPFICQKIGEFTIGYLEQISFQNEKNTLEEEFKNSYKEIKTIEKKLKLLETKMNENPTSKTIEEYTNALEHYEISGGFSYQKEYKSMLHSFGFTEVDFQKQIKDFSGGEKTKLAFLKLLISKNDILILDEPTNHLDIKSIEWLENFLQNYQKAFVIVSHDRMFLNNTVNTIYDISNKRVVKYSGNYEQFIKQKQANYQKALNDYEMQQKEIARLKNLYEKWKGKPSKAHMALSKLHRIEQMQILEKPIKERNRFFKANLKKIKPSGKTVLTCNNLNFGYVRPFKELTLEVSRGQKIGIMGPNGTGKSTLLKTIYGVLKPQSGTIKYGFNAHIGYFDQNLKMLDQNHTILEELEANLPDMNEEEKRNLLASFLFSAKDINKKINVLSGGEKVRLQLAKILAQNPNFLLLDEPTNHLDLDSKHILENLLKEYPGTILFVSHDRYFLKNLADSLIVFEEEQIKYYLNTYEEYLEKRKERIIEKETIKKLTKPKKTRKEEQDSKKKMIQIEKQIITLEKEKQKMQNKLLDPTIYNDFEKSRAIAKKEETIRESLQKLEKEWENIAKDLEI